MNRPILKVAGGLTVLALIVAALVALGSQTAPATAQAAAALATPAANSEPGVVIVVVDPDGPAAQAGVKRGDILLAIDATQVDTPADVSSAVRAHQVGDSVTLTLTHGDERRTLTARLADRNGTPYLGVKPFGVDTRFKVEALPLAGGAVIVDVVPGSPAETAGLKKGDQVLSVDGEDLTAENDLTQIVKSRKPGDVLTLKVQQPGEEAREVTVTLGENPDAAGMAFLGVTYAPRARQFFNLPTLPSGAESGAFVGNVVKDSPADRAGLKVGDVITAIDGQAITTPSEAIDALAAHKPGDSVTLTVRHANQATDTQIEVTLGEKPGQAGKAYLGVSLGGFFRHDFGGGNTPHGFGIPDFRFDFRTPVQPGNGA